MRVVWVTWLLFAIGCGGQVAASGDAGSSEESGLIDAGIPEPAPDSSQCNRTSGVCVFCSDQNWHCGDMVWPACPPGTDLEAGAYCAGLPIDNNDCFVCANDGSGDLWPCVGVMPKEAYWGKPIPYACSP
jgi:hypothetical protein